MKHPVDRTLRRVGYTVVGSSGRWQLGSYRLHRIGRVPLAFRGAVRRPQAVFEVDLEHVTTPCGFSYAADGWHPYLATLEQYLAEPDLPYERSVLSRYYAAFQPATVQEALLEDSDGPLPPLHEWPPLLHLFKHVWALTPRRVRRILAHPGLSKNQRQQFGPQTAEFGRTQVRRILAAHESIHRDGYRPHDYHDGALTGYLLTRGDDYRFVTFHGNHRLAALRALGVDRVQARFHWSHPPVVAAEELARWTTAGGGLFSTEVAERLFDKLFTELGLGKARNLGLI